MANSWLAATYATTGSIPNASTFPRKLQKRSIISYAPIVKISFLKRIESRFERTRRLPRRLWNRNKKDNQRKKWPKRILHLKTIPKTINRKIQFRNPRRSTFLMISLIFRKTVFKQIHFKEKTDLSVAESIYSPSECESLLAELIRDILWEQEKIEMYGNPFPEPRLSAWYGDSAYELSLNGNTR